MPEYKYTGDTPDVPQKVYAHEIVGVAVHADGFSWLTPVEEGYESFQVGQEFIDLMGDEDGYYVRLENGETMFVEEKEFGKSYVRSEQPAEEEKTDPVTVQLTSVRLGFRILPLLLRDLGRATWRKKLAAPNKVKKRYIPNKVVEHMFGVSRQAVRQWRLRKKNPLPYIRLKQNGMIFYDPDELYEWLLEHKFDGEIEAQHYKKKIIDYVNTPVGDDTPVEDS